LRGSETGSIPPGRPSGMMTRRKALTALSAALGSVTALGTAAGDDTVTETETNSTESEQQAGETIQTVVEQAGAETETDSGPDYLAQIANGLVLQDYRTRELDANDRSKMLLDIKSNGPKVVRFADAFGPFADSGVSTIDARAVAVESGQSTLGIECVEIRGQIGVSVATEDSFGIAVSTGLDSSADDTLTVAEGIGYGGGVALLGTGAAAWRKSRSDLDSPTRGGDDGR